MPDDPSHTQQPTRETASDARPAPYHWSADKSAAQIDQQILDRRIAAEQAHYERGFPVAGHDFRQEALQRDEQEHERSR